jgi:hypothetical protein
VIKHFRNSIIGVALLGGFFAVCGQNNTTIIKESDEAKTAQPQTVPGTTDTVKMVRDTVTDSAAAAQQAVYTPDTVGAIKPSETRTLQRRHEAKTFTGAGLGPAGFGNVDETKPAYDVYLGQFWEVNPHAAIKAVGEVASDLNKAHIADLTLGANFYALPTEFSPYIGGGMGLAYDWTHGGNAFGFNVGASLGALLFRTASAQMNLEGNAQMVMDQLSNSNDRPTIYSARLGVMF